MAIQFSIEELRGILLEAGLDAAAASSLAAAINGQSFGDDLEEHLAAQLRGKVAPEILERALAQANREAKRITGNLLQAELNKIAEKVAQNLAVGNSPEALARLLDEIKGLDKNRAASYEKYKGLLDQMDLTEAEYNAKLERMYQKLLRERKKTIAATEQRFATSEANRIIAESRGQQYKVWITVGDERVSDIDQANEAAGWIPIDEAFPSGDQQPPSHPNCRCTVAYRTSEPDEQAKQRAQERARNTEAATSAV